MIEVDLNLLRVFDALMELRSVTRAADRLGLTQSAISHALGRLRLRLEDRLFVRGPHGLQPTARALEIAPGIRDGLGRLRDALASSRFDPSSSDRRFTIAAGSYFCALLAPALFERARVEAPRVSFRIAPVADDLVMALDQGAVDMALGAYTRVPHRFVAEPLYREAMVWVAAPGNPLAGAGRLDTALLAGVPQIAVATGRALDGRGAIVAEGGLERQIVAEAGGAQVDPFAEGVTTVYDSQTAIALVARSDAVALVPRRIALGEAAAGRIALLDGGETAPGLELAMLWHAKQRDDAGLGWLRTLVLEVATGP